MKKSLPQIAVLIDNPISKDYRVLKEVHSLRTQKDLHFSVVGLVDKNVTEVFENIEENLDFYRVKAESFFDDIKRLMRATPVTMIGSLFIVTLATLIIYTVLPLPKFIKLFFLVYFLSVFMRILLEPKFPALKKFFYIDPLYQTVKSNLSLLVQKSKINTFKHSYSIQIEEIKPIVVHCHDFPMLEVACYYKQNFDPKVQIIYDSHELYEHMANKSKVQQIYYEKRLADLSSLIDHFITINPHIGDYYNQRHSQLPKAIIINNSLPLNRLKQFNFDLRKVSPLRKKIDADPDDIVILFQGVFNKERQLDQIILAMTKVKRDDIKLILMGWGQAQKTLENLIIQENLQNKVWIIPGVPQADLLDWTQGADLGLIPYKNNCLNHYFCSPNKLWEYAAAAVPLLAPSFPFIQAQIERYDLGYSVNEIDQVELAKVFNQISKDELIRKSQNCAQFIQESHWELNERELHQLYQKFIKDESH